MPKIGSLIKHKKATPMNTNPDTTAQMPACTNRCAVCGVACNEGHIVRYVVRGLDGSKDTGRIISKGDFLCDECGFNFDIPTNKD